MSAPATGIGRSLRHSDDLGRVSTGTSSSDRWRWSWCRPCSSPDCSGSGRGGASRSRRYAPGRRRFERATNGFSKWPDGSSTRRRRRGQGSPRTCTTTCASSSSSCRWGSARSSSHPDSSRTGDAEGPGDARGRHPEGVRGASTAVAGSASGDAATPRARGGPANALCRNGEATRRGRRLQRRSRPRQRPQGRRGVLLPDRPGGAAERHRARRRAPPVGLLAGSGEHLDLIVTDDGAGFDLTSVHRGGGGLGLVTMSERARSSAQRSTS